MLPLLLVGAAALFGGGVKKAAEGRSTSGRAATVAQDASIRQMASEERLVKAVKSTERAFERLAKQRASARKLLVDEVAPCLRRVAGVDDGGFTDLQEALARPERLAVAIGVADGAIGSTAAGALKGLGAGAALSGAAQSAVASLGVASTGASITGLSGAAASNATLAWFGGGSIASGGFGVAGGTAVLGGFVAAPAVLLAGLAYASSAQKQLTRATSYAAEVSVAVEGNKTAERRIAAIKRRVGEVRKAVDDVATRTREARKALDAMLNVVPVEHRSFGALPKTVQDKVLLLGVLAGLLSELIEVAIVDEAAQLLNDSADVLGRARALDMKEAA